MSGIIGLSPNMKSGVIISSRVSFKQAWGTTNSVPTGVLTSSTCTAATGRDNFNNGDHFDASTGIFTVPVAGIYLFGISAQREGANGSTVDLRWLKNTTSTSGNMWGRLYAEYDESYQQEFMGAISSAVPGDYFCVRNDSGSTSLYADDSFTFACLIN